MISLGCAKNLVDTEIALGFLVKHGATLVEEPAEADILVVNTCGFIGPAKEESIEAILEMAEYKRTGRCRGLIVTGCLSARYREELTQEIPEIDGLLGTGEMAELPSVIERVLGGQKVQEIRSEYFSYDDPDLPRVLAHGGRSAYLKIAEGCSHTCAFCVIPKIRGPLRSRSMDAVVAEARALAGRGVRELNLIAQDTTAYGIDQGQPAIAALLERLDREVTVDWIRLLYAYPTTLTDDVLAVIRKAQRIVPYFDIPLQHASTSMLRAMHRPGSLDTQRRLVDRIRQALPEAILRSSFIVGFPGETEDDFLQLLNFLEEVQFHRVGVFPFSREEDTLAYAMQEQVPEEVKQDRYERAMALQQQISLAHNKALVGRELDVLIEGRSDESDLVVVGRHSGQAPEVDGQVYLGSGIQQVGNIVPVRITDAHPYDLVGEIAERTG